MHLPLFILAVMILPWAVTPSMGAEPAPSPEPGCRIVVGAEAPAMEQYAAQELQRYLLHLTGSLVPIQTDQAAAPPIAFLVGQASTNAQVDQLAAQGLLPLDADALGDQGYVLKTLDSGDRQVLAIAACAPLGVLYGVYGLLEDHYGILFTLTGDILPPEKTPLALPAIDEQAVPRQAVRGVLPWTNFWQSATIYSYKDFAFVIDQMARMRMNFLHIHNYSGFLGHNEMFHNFSLYGQTSRVWFPTARSGHIWGGSAWNPSQYLFGGADLFDDYDCGSNATLHNESLTNEEVSAKGVALFQRVLAHAHRRGVKVGLGLELDVIPEEYQTQAGNPAVIDARIDQVIRDYPDLDCLMCFRSETASHDSGESWFKIFNTYYRRFKAEAPQTRLAASGWGFPPAIAAQLPEDVIIAPISFYTAGFDSGQDYGDREYWACPWLERDWQSSVYYYPYNIDLSQTIEAYQKRAPNMNGLLCCTWRIGDAVEPKLVYLGKAPWDRADRYTSSRAIYEEYARKAYGEAAAPEITAIIDQNEAFATGASESEGTPPFSGQPRTTDTLKARRQIATVDRWTSQTANLDQKRRLAQLGERLRGVEAFCELDESFPILDWPQLPGPFDAWARSFRNRVCDISSLGNLISAENRWVQRRYLERENALRQGQAVRAPSLVEARGMADGAIVTWHNEQFALGGFNVYRDGQKLTGTPLTSEIRSFRDHADGPRTYTITALDMQGQESPHSVPSQCLAGNADRDAPQVVILSPPTVVLHGQPIDIGARVLDGRTYDSIQATLYFRALGSAAVEEPGPWEILPMARRTRAIFATRIPPEMTGAPGGLIEYYVSATDGSNTGNAPASAPAATLSAVIEPSPEMPDSFPPAQTTADGPILRWQSAGDAPFSWNIYRSQNPDDPAGPASYVTYVAGSTTSFADRGEDFAARPLAGRYYYRVAALDKAGRESPASEPMSIDYASAQARDPYALMLATNFAAQSLARQVPCSEGWEALRLAMLSWASFGEVDFGDGATLMMLRVACGGPSSTYEVRLDNPVAGELIASIAMENTGGWQQWKTLTLPVVNARGRHVLYLRSADRPYNLLNLTENDLVNLHWIRFSRLLDRFEAENAEIGGVLVNPSFRAAPEDVPQASGGRALCKFGQGHGEFAAFDLPPGRGLAIAYANGTGQPRQCSLYVDGRDVMTLVLPPTAGWDTYVELPLPDLAFRNQLRLQMDSDDLHANGIAGELSNDGIYCLNFDYIRLLGTAGPSAAGPSQPAGAEPPMAAGAQ